MIVISGKRDGELVGKMGGAARGHGKRRANILFGTRHSEGVLEQCGDDVRYSALRRLCWKGTVRFEDEGIRVFMHSWYGLRSRRNASIGRESKRQSQHIRAREEQPERASAIVWWRSTLIALIDSNTSRSGL